MYAVLFRRLRFNQKYKGEVQMVSKQAQALISIYDAASNANGWSYSLDVCVDYVQAHGANLLFHENDKHSNWRGALHSASWRDSTLEQQVTARKHFEKYDASAWEFVHRHRKQTLFVDTDFWQDTHQLEKREDYRFFKDEMGFTRKVGCKLNDNLCWTDNIAFQFPSQQNTVSQESLQRIRFLLPHAAKSIELWRTFSLLKSQYKAVLAALDHVKVGLCVAEPGGSIIVANDEANRIFDLGGAISLGHDKHIHCRSEEMERSIRHAIQRSCATSSGEDTIAESFHVAGSKEKKQVSIEVAPLRDGGVEIESRFSGALVTLIDLSSELEINSEKIAKAYKLTASEQAVCGLLIRGISVNDIADTRNVTPETVKTQLKAVYRKTHCKSRVELTRLAIKADPPVS